MNLLFHPLTQAGTLAVGLLICLYLFVSLKTEQAKLRRRLQTQEDDARKAMEEMAAALSRLEGAVQEIEPPRVQPAQSLLPAFLAPSQEEPVRGASINLTKRSQALRMHRMGQSVEQVSAALQIPRREVELLFKVHRTVLGEG